MATTDIIPRITNSGKDKDSMGRWSHITIGAKKNYNVTIINAYRPCKQSHEKGISTTTTQQWDMLEELEQESTNIRDKMIDDLTKYINKLIVDHHEFLLFIDANESLTPDSRIAKLLRNTKMIDPITIRHGLRNIPNTHLSGSDIIDYCFCIDVIYTFIKKMRNYSIQSIFIS